MASKILVIGSPFGHLSSALLKASTLHSKNNFTLALLLGDVFSPTDDSETIHRLLRGEIPIPLPTYFTLGRHALPPAVQERVSTSSGEVCENLFFLGKKSVLNTSEGIRIIALGGRLNPAIIASATDAAGHAPFYTAQDAKSLKGANTADILLTYDWPEGVGNGSKLQGAQKGTRAVAELAAAVRPRYHFAAGGEVFWEREPYRNGLREGEGQGDVKVTRFLAVADWGRGGKAMYAFSVSKDAAVSVPADATGCPYKFVAKRGREEEGGGSFFWGEHTRGDRGGKRRGGRREKGPPPGPESCFFCLSYPQLEKHLIVSIGNEAYLTTAKGPLTNAASNPPGLPFSAHILIIPLTHTPTIAGIDDGESRRATEAEMGRYRSALEEMLKTRGCGAVTFEVARSGGVHAHWQVVPVPLEKMEGVESAFREAAEGEKLQGFERREVEEGEGDWFRVWVSGEEGALVCRLVEGEYFDLQFGRRVLAKVLGLKTVHWRDCVMSMEEETEDAKRFKEAFKEFDFSL